MTLRFINHLRNKATLLKSEILVLKLAYRHNLTTLKAKLLIAIALGYLLSPIDLIPDFIPFPGLLDDIVIVLLLITLSLKLIPQSVIKESRQKAVECP